MRKGTWTTAAVAFGFAAVVTTSARAQQTEEAIMALPVLSLTFSASYVAESLGLWDKEGLKVKIANIAGVGAINSVIAGSSDFAQTTAGTFTRAAARGQRLLAIANLIDRPMIEIVLRKDAITSKFDPKAPLEKRAEALRGRTIAVDAIATIVHGYVKIAGSRAGLDPEKDFRVAPMGPPNMLAALKSKAIDGFAMSQPWTLAPVDDGTAALIVSSPNGDMPEMTPFGYNLLVTRPEVCEKRRSVCVKMGRAMRAAVDYIHRNPKESIAILSKKFPGMDQKQMATAFDRIRTATPSPPIVNKEGLENAEIYNVKAGFMRADEKLPSYDGLFTAEFVR